MRLTCDLQEALPVCAPEKDSCLPPVDLFPIFYHFLTHLKYQKHQTDKYEILEEATHGHTLKKKNNNNKKNGWNMKISLSSLRSGEEENTGTKHSSSGAEPALNIKIQFTVWLHSSTSLLCTPSVSELYSSRMCMDEVPVQWPLQNTPSGHLRMTQSSPHLLVFHSQP